MQFESVGPSAVRAIRQREFLKEWIRLYARHGRLPPVSEFEPARISDEMPDLMIYDVEYIDAEPRYRVIRGSTSRTRSAPRCGFISNRSIAAVFRSRCRSIRHFT
jgi:hypothetical protein